MNYLINKNADTTFQSGCAQRVNIDLAIFDTALQDFQQIIHLIIQDIPVDIFAILGMRNLSAFVGELFAKSLSNVSDRIEYKIDTYSLHISGVFCKSRDGSGTVFAVILPSGSDSYWFLSENRTS